jgi:hypothetical protein
MSGKCSIGIDEVSSHICCDDESECGFSNLESSAKTYQLLLYLYTFLGFIESIITHSSKPDQNDSCSWIHCSISWSCILAQTVLQWTIVTSWSSLAIHVCHLGVVCFIS